MTNQELEAEFKAVLLRECSPVEREYLRTHPGLWTFALSWFVRGWDASNVRYVELVGQAIQQQESSHDV